MELNFSIILFFNSMEDIRYLSSIIKVGLFSLLYKVGIRGNPDHFLDKTSNQNSQDRNAVVLLAFDRKILFNSLIL